MKIFLFVVCIILIANLIRKLLKPGNPGQKNARQIRNALARLLKRPFGAYVIVEDPAFGKFVQFTGSLDEPLLFDLPSQALTLDEFEKARQMFAGLGYPGPETFEVFSSPDGAAAGTQSSFLAPLGDDIEGGTTLALEVFTRVYGVGEQVSLRLTEK